MLFFMMALALSITVNLATPVTQDTETMETDMTNNVLSEDIVSMTTKNPGLSITDVSPNMVINPSFEFNTSYWTAPLGSIAHNSANFYTTPGSVLVTNLTDIGSPYFYRGYAQQVVPISGSTYYYFNVAGRCDYTGSRFEVHLQWINITTGSAIDNEWPGSRKVWIRPDWRLFPDELTEPLSRRQIKTDRRYSCSKGV